MVTVDKDKAEVAVLAFLEMVALMPVGWPVMPWMGKVE